MHAHLHNAERYERQELYLQTRSVHVGYSANHFTRVKNLVTGQGAEMWEAKEGCAIHAKFLLQFFFWPRMVLP